MTPAELSGFVPAIVTPFDESGAIMEYLVERYGGEALRPAAGTDERLRYAYWMHYAEGSAMPLLVMKLIFTRQQGKPGLGHNQMQVA